MSTVGRLFALEHGFDEKKAGKYRLVIEELSTMLREHGFNDGKTHNINLRLVAKNEELIIRLRDDCTPFNLTEYYEMQEKVRKEDLGLHLIFGKAGRVQYTNTFGANNLIVRF